MEAAGQLGSTLREADAALFQLAPLRPYAAGARMYRLLYLQWFVCRDRIMVELRSIGYYDIFTRFPVHGRPTA